MATAKKRASKRTSSSAAAKRLKTYVAKRSFEKTPEPSGVEAAKGNPRAPHFVVQKHAASHMHYDFRLEHEGVLWSWAVPKGPSVKPGERRLAARTEDHPLSYELFEGIIPKGQYGGGTVIVWDRGTWRLDGDAGKAMKKGNLTFELSGEKLRGRFHLVRTKPTGKKGETWLLFKGRDAGARDVDIVEERPESVLSGRTVEQVEAAPAAGWQSNRATALTAKPKIAKKPKSVEASHKSKVSVGKKGGDLVDVVKRLAIGFPLTNLDKVLFEQVNVRKAELIAYYASISERMLPHIAGRPLTLVRCPSGEAGHCFYQKHATDGVPQTVRRILLKEGKKAEPYMCVETLPGLLALAQLGALEVHTWVCHADNVERPDQLVFDIDPDEGLPWSEVVRTAVEMRERLRALGLQSFVKTTGGKGLHVVLPVARKHDWQVHKAFAHGFVAAMAKDSPSRYVTNMAKRARKGKIFLDYLRNGRGATAVAPYSTRARPDATIAMPVRWENLADEDTVQPGRFTLRTVIATLEPKTIDPWADYCRLKQTLTTRALKGVGAAGRKK